MSNTEHKNFMPKKPLNKIRYPFLEGSFPENPLPYKKLNRKAIKISILSNRKGLTNKIRNIQKNIIEQETVSKIHKKTKFNNIFSMKKKPFSVDHTPNVPNIPSVTNRRIDADIPNIPSGCQECTQTQGCEKGPKFMGFMGYQDTVNNFINNDFFSKKISKTYENSLSKIVDKSFSSTETSQTPLTDKSSICNQRDVRLQIGDLMGSKVRDVKYGSKNLYLKNTEKPRIVTTKYMFSLEQLKAELYKKQSQYKKSSIFKNVLLERKKCSVIYGSLGEKQMRKVILQAKHCDGKFDENFIKIIESRLDVALYRICFFPSIFSAKQWIYHGNVLVNKKVNTLPGYILKAGDVISISSEKKTILKKKISFIIAKKLKIRESHYLSKINSFYTVVKNLVKYQDKNYSIYHNNKLLSTQHKSVTPITRNIFVKDVDTCYPSDENKKRIYQKDIYHQEELRKLVTFLKKSFQPLYDRSKNSNLTDKSKIFNRRNVRDAYKGLHKNNINRSIYLLPKVYPFFSLFLSPKTKSQKIDKIFSTFYPFLKIRNLFTSARPLKQRAKSYKISGIKPLNLEVCYKNMVAIFLYSPQKVALPATIDLPLIAKNF